MKIPFLKMNGAANDFVLLNNMDGQIRLTAQQIAWICDRRRGVGADGVIAPETSDQRTTDFFMRFYNSDGSEAEMCGNGSRCAAHFAAHLGLGRRAGAETEVVFATGSGMVSAEVRGEYVVTDLMDARDMRLNLPVEVAEVGESVHFITVGTRHAVVMVSDATALTHQQVVAVGRRLRHHSEFAPIGANVNFVSLADDGRVSLRTYEKGVEDETFACGTGSVGSCVVMAHLGYLESPRKVVQCCGDVLEISFRPTETGATNVRIGGPVAINFSGTLEI